MEENKGRRKEQGEKHRETENFREQVIYSWSNLSADLLSGQ